MISLLNSYSNKTSSMMGSWTEFLIKLYHISKSIIKLNYNVCVGFLGGLSLLYSSKRSTRIFHLFQLSLDLSSLDLVEFD